MTFKSVFKNDVLQKMRSKKFIKKFLKYLSRHSTSKSTPCHTYNIVHNPIADCFLIFLRHVAKRPHDVKRVENPFLACETKRIMELSGDCLLAV